VPGLVPCWLISEFLVVSTGQPSNKQQHISRDLVLIE